MGCSISSPFRVVRFRDATGAGLNYSKRNVLYRNNGDGTFTDVTVGRRTRRLHRPMGMGVSCRRLRQRRLAGPLRHRIRRQPPSSDNNGNGTFTDVTAKAGLSDTKHSGGKRRRCRGQPAPPGAIMTTTACSTCSSATTTSGPTLAIGEAEALRRGHARTAPRRTAAPTYAYTMRPLPSLSTTTAIALAARCLQARAGSEQGRLARPSALPGSTTTTMAG